MPRHFLFGPDPYLGFRAVRPHFLPWIRAVEPRLFLTNREQFEFTVRIADASTGDLKVFPRSGAELIIQSRQWRIHLFRYIESYAAGNGFGSSYLIPLVDQFFKHLKGSCTCLGSTQALQTSTETSYTADAWEKYL